MVDHDELRFRSFPRRGPQHEVANHEVAMARHGRRRAEPFAQRVAQATQFPGQRPVLDQPARLEEAFPGQVEFRPQQVAVERRRTQGPHRARGHPLDPADQGHRFGQAAVERRRTQAAGPPQVEHGVRSQVLQEDPRRRLERVPLHAGQRHAGRAQQLRRRQEPRRHVGHAVRVGAHDERLAPGTAKPRVAPGGHVAGQRLEGGGPETRRFQLFDHRPPEIPVARQGSRTVARRVRLG